MQITSPSKKQIESHRKHSTIFRENIRKSWRKAKLMPLALLMLLSVLVSGCASNSKIPEANSVSVDASLMVKPNYTERLVKLLSE